MLAGNVGPMVVSACVRPPLVVTIEMADWRLRDKLDRSPWLRISTTRRPLRRGIASDRAALAATDREKVEIPLPARPTDQC
jgi:hypothetical protein